MLKRLGSRRVLSRPAPTNHHASNACSRKRASCHAPSSRPARRPGDSAPRWNATRPPFTRPPSRIARTASMPPVPRAARASTSPMSASAIMSPVSILMTAPHRGSAAPRAPCPSRVPASMPRRRTPLSSTRRKAAKSLAKLRRHLGISRVREARERLLMAAEAAERAASTSGSSPPLPAAAPLAVPSATRVSSGRKRVPAYSASTRARDSGVSPWSRIQSGHPAPTNQGLEASSETMNTSWPRTYASERALYRHPGTSRALGAATGTAQPGASGGSAVNPGSFPTASSPTSGTIASDF
mmetsp:Transcript_19866/g.58637  ORF Transcript_19866/g.58637 Transcript_19866/m.58637 type:complete len:298 (-) Transcript_19866:487-1380(-)